MFHDSVRGAQASAVIYSLSETAKLNDLRPYYYFKHLLTELPNLCDEKEIWNLQNWMICCLGQSHFLMSAGNHVAEKRRCFTTGRMI